MHCDNEKCGCQNLTRKVPQESVEELTHRISEYERIYDRTCARYDEDLDWTRAEILRLHRNKWFQRVMGTAVLFGVTLHFTSWPELVLTIVVVYAGWYLLQRAYDSIINKFWQAR